MNQTPNLISRISYAFALLIVGWCSLIHAKIPHKLSYQGYLTSPSCAAINNAALSLTFELYIVASGGTELYSETQNVTVSNGIFNALIGSGTPLNLSFDQPYYVGITILGEASEMTPRPPLAAAHTPSAQ